MAVKKKKKQSTKAGSGEKVGSETKAKKKKVKKSTDAKEFTTSATRVSDDALSSSKKKKKKKTTNAIESTVPAGEESKKSQKTSKSKEDSSTKKKKKKKTTDNEDTTATNEDASQRKKKKKVTKDSIESKTSVPSVKPNRKTKDSSSTTKKKKKTTIDGEGATTSKGKERDTDPASKSGKPKERSSKKKKRQKTIDGKKRASNFDTNSKKSKPSKSKKVKKKKKKTNDLHIDGVDAPVATSSNESETREENEILFCASYEAENTVIANTNTFEGIDEQAFDTTITAPMHAEGIDKSIASDVEEGTLAVIHNSEQTNLVADAMMETHSDITLFQKLDTPKVNESSVVTTNNAERIDLADSCNGEDTEAPFRENQESIDPADDALVESVEVDDTENASTHYLTTCIDDECEDLENSGHFEVDLDQQKVLTFEHAESTMSDANVEVAYDDEEDTQNISHSEDAVENTKIMNAIVAEDADMATPEIPANENTNSATISSIKNFGSKDTWQQPFAVTTAFESSYKPPGRLNNPSSWIRHSTSEETTTPLFETKESRNNYFNVEMGTSGVASLHERESKKGQDIDFSATFDAGESDMASSRDIEEGKGADFVEVAGERQAGLLLGCCDILKGTVIVDIIYLVMNITLLVLFVAVSDELLVMDESTSVNLIVSFVGKIVIGIIMGSFGIYGALRYQKWLVLLTAIWLCIDFIFNVFLNWKIAIPMIAFIFPQVALFRALHQGKITPENYKATEEYCRCLPNFRREQVMI